MGWSWLASRAEDRVEYLAVPGAAADVATERDLRLGQVGMGPLVEQLGPGHEHAGDAVATLRRAMRDKGALEGMQVVVGCTRQAFDGSEARAVGLRRRN